MKKRPKTIVVVSVFLFAASAVAAVTSTSLLFPNRILDKMWRLNPPAEQAFRSVQTLSGALLMGLAIGTLCAAAGLLRGRPWAWWFAVAIFAVNALGDLVSVVITHDFVRSATGAGVAGIFLYALTRPGVRLTGTDRHAER